MKIHIKNIAKLNIFDLQIVLMYLVFLKPPIIDDIQILDLIWNALRVVWTVWYSFKFLLKKKKMAIGWYFYFGSFVAVLFSTIIQSGQMSVVIGHFIPTLGIVAWIELNKKYLDRIFKWFCIVGGLLICINLLTIIVFPDGILKRDTYMSVWLLGQKQEFINCALGVIVFAGICGYKDLVSSNFIRLVLGAIIISMLYLKPMGPIIACVILIFIFLIERVAKIYFGNVFLYIISIFGEMVVLLLAYEYKNMTWLQLFLNGFATSGMSKGETIGTRAAMWEYACEMFLQNPIIGAGQVTEQVWYETSNLYFYHSIVHNMYLDFAFTGGIIALVFFLLLNVRAITRLQKYYGSKIARFVGICFFALSVLQLLECLYNPMVVLIYFLPEWLYIIQSKEDRRLLNDKNAYK